MPEEECNGGGSGGADSTTPGDPLDDDSRLGVILQASILPLLTGGGGATPTLLTKHDMSGLVTTILAMERKMLDFERSFPTPSSETSSFYCSFAALSANVITSNAAVIVENQVLATSNACTILLRYLLHVVNNYSEQVVLTKNQLVNIIYGLIVDVCPLSQMDVISLSATLKSVKIPESLAPRIELEGQASGGSHQGSPGRRPSSDLIECHPIDRLPSVTSSAVDYWCESFLQQLMTPIFSDTKGDESSSSPDTSSSSSPYFTSHGEESLDGDPSVDTKALLLSKNLTQFHSLEGGSRLIHFIATHLSNIKSYVQTVQSLDEVGGSLSLPTTVGEANKLIKDSKYISKDYEILSRVLSLPILEASNPPKEEQMKKLLQVIHACLAISVSLIAAQSTITIKKWTREDSGEEGESNIIATEIIENSLLFHQKVVNELRSIVEREDVTHLIERSNLFTSWILLSGLKYFPVLNSKTGGADKSSISVFSLATTALTSLLEDLNGDSTTVSKPEPRPSDDSSSSSEYYFLLLAMTQYLEKCRKYLSQKDVVEKLEGNNTSGRHHIVMESTCFMLSFLGDVFEAIKNAESFNLGRAVSPLDLDYPETTYDSDVVDDDFEDRKTDRTGDKDDNDSNDEESDEDDDDSLCNKLCTFTQTQREFSHQHWYHCHTCEMTDRVGVCTICARVCHRDHDVTYAKYGSFFCDCGAREDGSCAALVRRPPLSDNSNEYQRQVSSSSARDGRDGQESLPHQNRRRKRKESSSDRPDDSKKHGDSNIRQQILSRQIKNDISDIQKILADGKVCSCVLSLMEYLTPTMLSNCKKESSMGAVTRTREAMKDLHTLTKKLEQSDSLMTPTLGSQEGAFENVKLNYSGEQGQLIRQLITSNVIRRVAMCAMTGGKGRQHLAVSHEKGKITLLQLSGLLKQADSSRRKLTLTRLSSAPVPFTVLSIEANYSNEDVLSVCGLKDCHVLTLSSNGTVSSHLILNLQLESGNHVIKSLWIPGSQTELCVITSEFVKIFDLSISTSEPQYILLVPSGKVRDVTFICPDKSEGGERSILFMSSSGYIYWQYLNEEASAINGAFYVTNVLEIHETSSFMSDGGVSLHFSHTLETLFIGYSSGKAVMTPIRSSENSLSVGNVFIFEVKPSTSSSSPSGPTGPLSAYVTTKSTSINTPHILCQWREVQGHPGLLFAMSQQTNNPIVLMIKPDTIVYQEIKSSSPKGRITDMVSLRHTTNTGEMKTTLILLCEDGSLRIYTASVEGCNFWLRPSNQSLIPSVSNVKSSRRKKGCIRSSSNAQSANASGPSSIPVDFFEHCTLLNDIEFGGNDVLQIYNVQQLKNRLNTNGMYVASTKSTGFSIEVINNDPNVVMVGCRVFVGSQDVTRAPSYIEIFGRSVLLYMNRSRWYDLPFTREETLSSDKRFTITFGPSNDPNSVTMVDSIKVYGKSKESFGWPEEDSEEVAASGIPSSSIDYGEAGVLRSLGLGSQLSYLDRLLNHSLEVLNGHFTLSTLVQAERKDLALSLATKYLVLPFPSLVLHAVKSLLLTLHSGTTGQPSISSSHVSYYAHRDSAILTYVMEVLNDETNEVLDGETFYRLISSTRAIAANRPGNLIKFCDRWTTTPTKMERGLEIEMKVLASEASSSSNIVPSTTDKIAESKLTQSITGSVPTGSSFIIKMNEVFWRLLERMPRNSSLTPVPVVGLVNVDSTVSCLIEIIHSFTLADSSNLPLASQLYLRLLLSEYTAVSFAAKSSIVRVLKPKTRKKEKKVFIPSPPSRSPVPEIAHHPVTERSSGRTGPLDVFGVQSVGENLGGVAAAAPFNILAGAEAAFHNFDNVAAAGGAAGQMLDIPPLVDQAIAHMMDMPGDADDDQAMVELAIALSLQDQRVQEQRNIQPEASAQGVPHHPQAADGMSDTTASPNASDDEGSTAATDGSTLRTSPVVVNEPGEHGIGGEEGGEPGSPPESEESLMGEQSIEGQLVGGSGRSSAYPTFPIEESSQVGQIESSDQKLHSIRLGLLEKLIESLPRVRSGNGGVNSIPFMQVILMLSSDLDSESEVDRGVFSNLLTALIRELDTQNGSGSQMVSRSNENEVKLIIMRILSLFMSKVKSSSSSSSGSKEHSSPHSLEFSRMTASLMISSGLLDLCLEILVTLLSYWKESQGDEEAKVEPATTLLRAHPSSPPPDMSPFFLKQYVKQHADDVFELYPQLLSEMVLRLPYQIKKISNSSPSLSGLTFPRLWMDTLCEYMMISLTTYVKKQVRKLLSYICGSKESYRQIRDFHSLDSHLREVKKVCSAGGYDSSRGGSTGPLSLSYDSTVSLIEHLKAMNDIASGRTANWQKYCQKEKPLSFLFQVSFLLEEGVSPIILYLLNTAICPVKSSSSKGQSEIEANLHTRLSSELMIRISEGFPVGSSDILSSFIRVFLLESNSTALRWQTHALLYNLFKNFDSGSRERKFLLDTMWSLWPTVSSYGRRGAQFVDLLGYFSLKTPLPSEKEGEYAESAVSLLRGQNLLLATHPNSNIYNSLQGLVEFDGFFLESEPCLVCNNPEVNYSNIKLSSLKVDSRFTTTTQIVKLISSHTISKIFLRISDIKRTKMIKTLTVYYNNRAVQSVVELKRTTPTSGTGSSAGAPLWHKGKKVTLTPAQSEVKIDFPLPIIACNLMIEYGDFYENIQASSETSLQCPRCSASVPATPGVCGNCGENVFQCHKCRAINYDEKDPFLCNSCGFCKYAKFDYTLTAKSTCAVDPIESEEDRKKTVSQINSLLEKADRAYKNLVMNKPALELLLLKIQDQHTFVDKMSIGEEFGMPSQPVVIPSQGQGTSGAAPGTAHVNRAIQQIAYKYCHECRSSFEELSKIIKRVLAARKELVSYDNKQRDMYSSSTQATLGTIRRDSKVLTSLSSTSGRCFGCASATVEHCITLLKALSSLSSYRHHFVASGLLRELLDFNPRYGSSHVRHEVRLLLCSLTKDNMKATTELNNMITEKVTLALKSRPSGFRMDLSSSVRHEMALLITSIEREDSCWEQGLRCLMKIFLMSISIENPVVLETVTLPCLRLLLSLVKPEPAKSSRHQDKTVDQISTVKASGMTLRIDLDRWLPGCDDSQSFKTWKARSQKDVHLSARPSLEKMSKTEVRNLYLSEKYSSRWRELVLLRKRHLVHLSISPGNWLRVLLFNRYSRTVRVLTCSLLEAMFSIPSRSKDVIDFLASCLEDLGPAGEYGTEYFNLFRQLVRGQGISGNNNYWKHYLAVKGKILLHLGREITREIDILAQLEETTLNSDLSEGCALKMMVDLLTTFVEVPTIRQAYKSRLVSFLLNGYLSLRKLVVQRTKIIEDTQECLLQLLEDMTTGTEGETEQFMTVCVEAISKCRLDDLRTPVFLFEQLCSIISPEDSVGSSDFYIILEKDPAQEDFLQGRMLGNPYSSSDPGMGPLMRDIKTKICTDCELVALLEDNSGMELLVCNKIISLDLPVREVYRKVWCTENSESESMRIIYRMRGLMGDATEEFIESLDTKDAKEVDNEVVFRLANRMSDSSGVAPSGLEVMLERLRLISDLSPRCRPLLLVLLKLMSHCVKVKSNRRRLIDPSLKAIEILIPILKMCLSADPGEIASLAGMASSSTSTGPSNVIEQLLSIIETISLESSQESRKHVETFSKLCGTKEDILFLLKAAVSGGSCSLGTGTRASLMKVIPLLSLGDEEKIKTMVDFFTPFLNFKRFDFEHSSQEETHLESFCLLVNSDTSPIIKDYILNETEIITDALEYLSIHAPPVKSTVPLGHLATREEWKEFTQRSALKYVLRILTGVGKGHPPTQLIISSESIPIIHGLEQVSSDAHVGSLAESLLDAIKDNQTVAEKIEQVRRQTREEKKKLAMAVRQKQLGQLGMRTNERGQVTAKSVSFVEDLGEETGLTCIICREGYKFQPTKVLGIYTFTKRIQLESWEGCGPNVTPGSSKGSGGRKTMGYTTVTHFNVVHVDCHMSAVRHARGRDEWESASLQNASTRCNGLLPLWGSQVQESSFASCLARHNTYLQEATGSRDVNYYSTLHDLKLLLLKFANEESFSADSGGGGPQSNIHLIPYLIHIALYVLNTTRSVAKEVKKVSSFLEQSTGARWIDSSFEVEGVNFYACLFVAVNPPSTWRKQRMIVLKRLIVQAQARHCFSSSSRQQQPQSMAVGGTGASPGTPISTLPDTTIQGYSVYKGHLVFFALIDGIYSILLKGIGKEDDWAFEWSLTLAEYIRNNDQALLESSEKLLNFYQEDILSCCSFAEFCDVMSLHEEIPNPDEFMSNTLQLVK